MTLNFPSSPSTGQTHNATNGVAYYYDGVKWTSQGTYASSAGAKQYIIDDISGGFNGSTTGPFNLHHNGDDLSVSSAIDITISVGGVIQDPNTAYTVSSANSTITFTEAPATGETFFGILKSKLVDQNITVSDGTISTSKLVGSAVTTAKLADNSVNSAKIIDDSIVNADVNSSAGIVATKLSFTQTGSNAVARTVDSKLEDVLSVKDFGATGDGATDDTTAINNCIAAAGLTKAVYFPPGTYITSGINQNHYDNSTWSVNADADGAAKTYRIYGDSPSTSIIKAKASSNSTLVSKVKKIDNIHIQGVQGTVCCINIDHSSQRIHNVKISGDNSNRNTYGIYYSPFHPQNANSSGDTQSCCCAYLNDVIISECATGLAIWGTVSGQSPTSGTNSHHYAAHANDSQYNRIHVYNTTTAGIHIKCRAGGLTFRDTNLSQMSGKGLWIQGGRKLEFDGIYTAAYGPATTSTYWTVYYDAFVETVTGLKILNPREEQTSTRSYFAKAYNAELRGGTGLNNIKFVGETAYTNDIWRLDNYQEIGARDDAGNDTAHWGACISKFPLTNRGEFLAWEGLFDNEFRQATGTTGNKTVTMYDDNANWGTNGYDFVETDIQNVTTGRPCAFQYYRGCTDVARMWSFHKGSNSSVGMMVYNSGTYIGMARAGNGGSSILSLSCSFNFADLLDPTVAKTSSAAPADGDWITIIPVAKANGGSRYLYKSRIIVACAPLAHQNSWI